MTGYKYEGLTPFLYDGAPFGSIQTLSDSLEVLAISALESINGRYEVHHADGSPLTTEEWKTFAEAYERFVNE